MRGHVLLQPIATAILIQACGSATPSQNSVHLALPQAARAQALLPGDEGPPNNPPEISLPEVTIRKVQRSYDRLKHTHALDENNWRFNEPLPPGRPYARVDLEDDSAAGIYDGYAKYAMVPVEATDREPNRFFLMREGGIGGWQFVLGPFPLQPLR